MINIIIVEDDLVSANLLRQCISDYFNGKDDEFSTTHFNNAIKFLDEYKADADIVFMDIQMPNMSGMDASKRLRQIDDSVILVFVTNMQQFAIQGYSVNAFDFILKPITYTSLSQFMTKALKVVEAKYKNEIIIKLKGSIKKTSIAQIRYVEVSRHRLTYHTLDGEFEGWGTLDSLEKTLPKGHFARCHIGYLVGLKHVVAVDNNDVIIGKDRIQISRNRKKEFLAQLATYLGGNFNV